MLDRSIVDTGDASGTDGAVDCEALWSAGTDVCIEISLSHKNDNEFQQTF